MIGAYGASRAGEIAAGVNLFVVNPSSMKSLTLLSSNIYIYIYFFIYLYINKGTYQKKRPKNEHAPDLCTRVPGSCLIFAS